MSDKDNNDAVDMMFKTCDTQGVGVLNTSDSYVLAFNRKYLLELCEKYSDKEKFVICVKKPVSN
jgi:hypothetical protein